ncbi:metalloregulator ArsR/SmtB family transcription factor [Clostridium sp. A1-XYC3]|uniref:Metalloregulator ArsR/SmtB family transcription factor n=1 Tax=Clostridium tanneri TaxID=3037988 RepID=A0ABU4JTV1_9CLOT|nr:metalloregulator ArsR/SmtB family transcription factor [Clostridium sp. A1-XYC3]MDW8801574.1 metalloregulator ArsR/SmtB family transcription factor [Clostridium sp. A1-XYC3]
MNDIVQIFKALGDETRLKILIILSRRKICAKGISRHLNISEAAVSQHLKILREAEIIIGEKVGYYVYYNLQQTALLLLTDFINELKGDEILGNCKFTVDIPMDCKAACKANKYKCCEKNKV